MESSGMSEAVQEVSGDSSLGLRAICVNDNEQDTWSSNCYVRRAHWSVPSQLLGPSPGSGASSRSASMFATMCMLVLMHLAFPPNCRNLRPGHLVVMIFVLIFHGRMWFKLGMCLAF